MVDSYLVSFAGLLLTLGTLGDRFGRKRALQTGIALFGALEPRRPLRRDAPRSSSPSAPLMGVGGALIMPATLSIITNVFPREERAKAIGMWAGTAAIGVGLGPLFGGLLLEYFDWSSVFLINVPVALVAFVAGMRFVPGVARPQPGPLRRPRRAAVDRRPGGAHLRGHRGARAGWLDPAILGAFGGGAGARGRVRGLGAAHGRADARPEPVPQPALQHRLAARSASPSSRCSARSSCSRSSCSSPRATRRSRPARRWCRSPSGSMLGATRATKLVERVGTKRVVAAGLIGLGTTLTTTLLWTSDMPYWPIGLWFFFWRSVDGLHHGPGHRLGHGRGAQGEGRRRVGDERRHPPGRRARWAPP